jgi:hypothetical protein
VGHLPKEQPTGAVAELWTATLQGSGLSLTDAAAGTEGGECKPSSAVERQAALQFQLCCAQADRLH